MDSQIFTIDDLTQSSSELLVPIASDGHLIDDIKTILSQNRDVARKLDVFKREFEHDRKVHAKWREQLDEKLDRVLTLLGSGIESEESQSILNVGPNLPFHQPFLTIKYKDGSTENIHFQTSVVRDLMSSSKIRELVRKLLLALHSNDIALLRKFTLSGKSFLGAKRGNEGSFASPKVQLPVRSQLIIVECVKKLNPVDPDIQRNPVLVQEHIRSLEKKLEKKLHRF